MFGFVYLWYLMLVLLLEIGFEYRADMVRWSNESHGLTVYKLQMFGMEGLFVAIALPVLPFLVLWALVTILPPWDEAESK